MIYRDRTCIGLDRNGTGTGIMIPFRSVYRFNVSHPVPNTSGLDRYRCNPFRCPALVAGPVAIGLGARGYV
ncbi:hypothetical protein H5410_035519 [Solanum commersonii]|uniref:Uncharacterized protein n=1 Tax=Solanum commersonii TaxID=4109 RepID=A0A9J5Y341_SOLCO|nr:hypothetical protein H5410_035519 [Solanum commersonii]